jgi:O-antigen/teichoic acid export membrane protein
MRLFKHQLVKTSVAVLISRVAQSATSFVLTLSIARILGPFALGQYMLGYAVYLWFMTIASHGLKVLFTRELSSEPDRAGLFLGNGTWLQLALCLIAYAALVLLVALLPYAPDTARVCIVLGLAVIPFSLSNIIEAIFQAFEKLHLVAFSTVPIYVLRVVASIGLMLAGYDILLICWIQVISEVVVLLVEGILIRRQGQTTIRHRQNPKHISTIWEVFTKS